MTLCVPINFKYLVYFKPNKHLEDLILNRKDISIPREGLHCTLMFFYMDKQFEQALIEALSKIEYNQFEVQTLEFADFDHGSLVIKVSNPKELNRLHKDVLATVKRFANEESQDLMKRYFGDNYSPHITISKSDSGFDTENPDLLGLKTDVDEFVLARKDGDIWHEIEKWRESKRQ